MTHFFSTIQNSSFAFCITPYDVPPKMCRGTYMYVAITKLITKSYKNNIKTDDDISASIFAECINIGAIQVLRKPWGWGVSALPEKSVTKVQGSTLLAL